MQENCVAIFRKTVIHNSPFIIPRVIVSAIEHESVLETARDLEKEGVEVIYIPVSKKGIVDLKIPIDKTSAEEKSLLSLYTKILQPASAVPTIS